MKLRKLLLIVLVLIAGLLVYLLAWPVPVAPLAWTPPAAPALTGVYAPNSKLSAIEKLNLESGFGPEDVAIDSQDRIYGGVADGRIMRFQPDGTRPEVFANTQGRPLGLVFDSSGRLIVADARKGLLAIDHDGNVTTLSTEAGGVPFRCTNDLDIAADGTIYFTDASSRFALTELKEDIVEHQGNGRLLAYASGTKTTRLVLGDLYFANGVAVSPDGSFLLVVETGAYRVRRVWLNGPRQGQSDIFIDNLPGFPDGISSNGRDTFWLALVTPRDPILDRLMPHPFLRKAILRLPSFLQPAIKRYAFALELDMSGRVVTNLQDPSPQCFAQIANVVEHKDALYFGSIGEAAIGRLPLRFAH
ncbi:MAG TPA: SMP-30/gluconolactonase/LRE family protein [Pyrinomonadaceae bacterium]